MFLHWHSDVIFYFHYWVNSCKIKYQFKSKKNFELCQWHALYYMLLQFLTPSATSKINRTSCNNLITEMNSPTCALFKRNKLVCSWLKMTTFISVRKGQYRIREPWERKEFIYNNLPIDTKMSTQIPKAL